MFSFSSYVKVKLAHREQNRYINSSIASPRYTSNTVLMVTLCHPGHSKPWGQESHTDRGDRINQRKTRQGVLSGLRTQKLTRKKTHTERLHSLARRLLVPLPSRQQFDQEKPVVALRVRLVFPEWSEGGDSSVIRQKHNKNGLPSQSFQSHAWDNIVA
jgi:hypothetical protein